MQRFDERPERFSPFPQRNEEDGAQTKVAVADRLIATAKKAT
jgi:hypothetical protein